MRINKQTTEQKDAALVPIAHHLDDDEAGMVTAEYAVGIIAAVAFAGLLLAVVKSGSVQGLLEGIISKALNV
ncbi:DUF4244 domain-containing protein [Gleimia hominis]|uniref:DUF4244 domain-containing protein n=1 Tax=Gleimia hominis TaxID=595468 RepID=A0ABU3I8B5_9ACTO|nr:DUF4244 domain-containing protein [Gleimia hominis]MDT3766628.1 DUF4244 domain-containing protein [Gleimia hominis]